MRRIRTFAEAGPRLVLLAVLALLAAAASLLVGPGLSWAEVWNPAPDSLAALILWELRVPRALTALLVGAALAGSGAVVQGMLRNPLAGPEVLGISAGAGAGALILLTVSGWPWGASGLTLGALAGAGLTALVILRLATVERRTSLTGVLLAGMALSSLLAGLTTLLLTLHRETQVGRYLFWLVGSLENRRWEQVGLLLPFTAAALVLMLILAGRLNVLALGETTARTLGLRVQPLKVLLLAAVVLATGSAVAVSGAIGFLGLLIPHMVRLLWGQDARWFVPLSALAGAGFLVAADTAVRLVFSPFEVPVGIFTALLGAPFFLVLLVRQQRREGGQ